jgi:HD-like signal output (HDOD) protein
MDLSAMTARIPKENHSSRLERAIALAQELPPLSSLARHLLATISAPGEGPPLSEVANWIEKDTMTAGKVLALANSALYARSVPTLSVRAAVSRLGLIPLRNLVVHTSMSNLWSRLPTNTQWSATRFNTHSIATGLFCELIASAIAPEQMEVAFLGGLFHDTGRLIIAMLLHDDTAALELLREKEHDGLETLEMELVGFTHSEGSALLARTWNLPASIETAIRFHENPEADPTRGESKKVLLSEMVHAADWYVDCHGYSLSGVCKDEDKTRPLRELGFATDDSGLFARFHDELDLFLNIL